MCLAIPGQVVEISDDEPLFRHGKVDFGGIRKEVSLACTPEVEVGQYVLVHVGLAINTIDEAEAERVFQYLEEMEDYTAELGEDER